MKKIIILPLLLFLHTAILAQQTDAPIAVVEWRGSPLELRSFGVLRTDKDFCIEKLTAMLGMPSANTIGNITWEAIAINGLPEKVNIHISDGILTDNAETKSACWSPFKSKADKQKKLAALTGNQSRVMRIEITDTKGANIVDNDEKEKAVLTFLNKAF